MIKEIEEATDEELQETGMKYVAGKLLEVTEENKRLSRLLGETVLLLANAEAREVKLQARIDALTKNMIEVE